MAEYEFEVMSTEMIDPAEVRELLARIKGGDSSLESFAGLLAVAEFVAGMEVEYGFDVGSVPGIRASVRNVLLAETMHAAKPDQTVYVRVAPDWQRTDDEPPKETR